MKTLRKVITVSASLFLFLSLVGTPFLYQGWRIWTKPSRLITLRKKQYSWSDAFEAQEKFFTQVQLDKTKYSSVLERRLFELAGESASRESQKLVTYVMEAINGTGKFDIEELTDHLVQYRPWQSDPEEFESRLYDCHEKLKRSAVVILLATFGILDAKVDPPSFRGCRNDLALDSNSINLVPYEDFFVLEDRCGYKKEELAVLKKRTLSPYTFTPWSKKDIEFLFKEERKLAKGVFEFFKKQGVGFPSLTTLGNYWKSLTETQHTFFDLYPVPSEVCEKLGLCKESKPLSELLPKITKPRDFLNLVFVVVSQSRLG